ncbi:2OG-Fe(II) oxygenase [Candidatus Pelagibacter bacterium]|nr:2OG-Fe(II) oxygenase [Candidatus Pelagibacter bacterium]MDB2709242.1 2OG-Fe(II) oxygenase [Candidatus Pelagibacter bacterium]
MINQENNYLSSFIKKIMLQAPYRNLTNYKKKFLKNKIFPHINFYNFIEETICEEVNNEIDKCVTSLNPYFVVNTKKYALNDKSKMGKKTIELIDYLNSQEFIKNLESLTGIKNLIPDPKLEGGGIHVTKKNGYLKIHSDFESHIINKTWKREINLLLYFNKNFKESYNANLELYSENLKEKVEYSPSFNSAVIFNTNKKSLHGHPKFFSPKKNEIRKSIALYYYTDAKKNLPLKETNFIPLSNENFFGKIAMKIDQYFLRIFSYLKRKKIINDKIITNLIKLIKRN